MESIPDLSGLSELEFEAERCRIINSHLHSLPEDVSRRMRLFQMNLDVDRMHLQKIHGDMQGGIIFMRDCFRKISENLANLSDAYGSIGHAAELTQPSLPNYANERII